MKVESFFKEYEQNLLGSVLIDNANLDKIASELEGDDFYFEKHQVIYKAMLSMKEEDIPIDPLTLRNFLENGHKLKATGGSSYITYLTEMFVPGSNLEYYGREIKKSSNRRKLWESCHEVIKDIESGKELEVIEDRLEKLTEITTRKSPENPLKPISAADLDDIPPTEALWGDIIYPGFITQLNSEPGVGKSTFVYNIAANGALEKDFLDIGFFKKIKPLYVDLETPPPLCKRKIELICDELPSDFFILQALDLKADFNSLLELCKKEKYDLIVLDTQSRVFNMEQENDNSEANILMGLLRRLANETGIAILLIHHTTKGDGGKAVYKGRGASAIAASVDVVINLESLDKGTLQLNVVKSRMPINNPSLIIRKVGDDKFELEKSCAEIINQSNKEVDKIQEFIISLLSENTEPIRAGIITDKAEQVGFKKRTIEDALNRLFRSGEIQKPKHGFYLIRENEVSADSANPTLCGTAEPAESQSPDMEEIEI